MTPSELSQRCHVLLVILTALRFQARAARDEQPAEDATAECQSAIACSTSAFMTLR